MRLVWIGGSVALEHWSRCFYADDLLPDGATKARDADGLEGLDPELRERWLTQKRQRSSGPQYARERKHNILVRVSGATKAALQTKGEERGITASTLAARVLEEWAEQNVKNDREAVA